MRVLLLSTLWIAGVGILSTYAQQPIQSEKTEKTITLFDGKTLNGWKPINPGDAKYWQVKDSLIIGGDGINNVPQNMYLQTTDEYGDFELRCLFRLSGDASTGFINSGIQYRSKVEGNDIVGYQADIGDGHWGDIYDEHRRGLLSQGDLRTAWHILERDGWNSYIVRVRGNRHELYINGVKTNDYVETDSTVPVRGIIAFQLHGGGAAKIEIRDVTITTFD